jgi:hypothetical protein
MFFLLTIASADEINPKSIELKEHWSSVVESSVLLADGQVIQPVDDKIILEHTVEQASIFSLALFPAPEYLNIEIFDEYGFEIADYSYGESTLLPKEGTYYIIMDADESYFSYILETPVSYKNTTLHPKTATDISLNSMQSGSKEMWYRFEAPEESIYSIFLAGESVDCNVHQARELSDYSSCRSVEGKDDLSSKSLYMRKNQVIYFFIEEGWSSDPMSYELVINSNKQILR